MPEYRRDAVLRDLSLPDEARELLRRWCPRAVTIADFDATPVRISFATMVRCKERTLAERLYRQFGLPPLTVAYADDDSDAAGCLYMKAPLATVKDAIRRAYEQHGLALVPRVSEADVGTHAPHPRPRTAWRADVVVVQPDDDGFVAVGSREWELAFPAANALALVLSSTAPVLAITTGVAFDEITVYAHGEVVASWVPRGRASFRAQTTKVHVTRELLVDVFGELPRWNDLAARIAAAAEGDDDDAAGGVEDFATSFAHHGFFHEIESVFDSYAHGPPVDIPELMGFAKPAKVAKAAKPAKPEPAVSGVATAGGGRTDMLAIVSKAVFEKQHRDAALGDVLPIDRYTSTNPALARLDAGGSLVLVTVRPGDTLWLVAILDAPSHRDGAWIAATNQTPITDLTGAFRHVRFASGAVLEAAPGKLGMALQTPRALGEGVLADLRGLAHARR